MMKGKAVVISLSDHFAEARKSITGAMLMRAALAGGFVIETHAKINVSRGRPGLAVDTGNLVNSIGTVPGKLTTTFAEAEVGTGVEYAAIHEFGGVILPLRAKMLSWITDGGERVFAKMVQIPARPYMRPAADEHLPDIKRAVERQIKDQLATAAPYAK